MDKLLIYLTEPPILAYPDYSRQSVLRTSASCPGLGCGLFQEENGTMRVVRYKSRILIGSEKKYHSSKTKFLAFKWLSSSWL